MGKEKKHVVRRILLGLALGLYILVAILNSTVVQSYLGAAVGSYFSKEWGGKVRIGALHASPFSHVILDKIELISPTNDTIYYGDRITCRFKRFPYRGSGLEFRSVELWNGRYHLHTFRTPEGKSSINLDFIIKYFAERASHEPKPPAGPFTVEVGELRLHNIDYIQDLPEPKHYVSREHGVDIPHMRYWDISGVMRNVKVVNDHVKVRIVSLSTTEESGLHIADLSMDAEVSSQGINVANLDLQTDDSRVFMDARLDYDGWEEMSDYCNTVVHDVVLKEGTEVNLKDAAWWAPAPWGVDATVTTRGHVFGTIADLTAEQLLAAFGSNSNLFLDAHIKGLPNIQQTTLQAILHRMHTNYGDLAAVQLPESVTFELPALVKNMSVMDLSAEVNGGMQDIEAWVNMNSMIGDLETHARLTYDTAKRDYTYWGDVDSRMLGIRALLPNEWVWRTGMHLSFRGAGLDPETMDANIEGRLYNTLFRGVTLDRTSFSAEMAAGELNAEAGLHDTLIGLDLTASANLKENSYQADMYLNNAHLTALHLFKADSSVRLSTRLRANIQGKELEQLSGFVSLDNTQLQLGDRELTMRNIVLQALSEQVGTIEVPPTSKVAERRRKTAPTTGNIYHKNLSLGCDWLEASVDGHFAYTDLPLIGQDFCRQYLPLYYNPYKPTADGKTPMPAGMERLAGDDLHIELTWYDREDTFDEWVQGVDIAYGTSIIGNYNYGESLKLVMLSDSIKVGNLALTDLGLNAGSLGEQYRMRLSANDLRIGASTLMQNPELTASMGRNISTLAVKWISDNPRAILSRGDMELFVTSTEEGNRIVVSKPDFYVMGEPWNLISGNGIWISNERTEVDDLRIYGQGQWVRIDADIAGGNAKGKSDGNDYVQAQFSDFSVEQLCSLLLSGSNIKVDGTLDGNLRVKDISTAPFINADLQVSSLSVNEMPLGNLQIQTHQQPDDSRLYVDVTAQARDYTPLALHGSVLPVKNTMQLDFNLAADRLPMVALQPFLATVTDRLEGTVSGALGVEGTLKAPHINGSLAINQGAIKLSATGVDYRINDSVTVVENIVTLKDFTIRDLENNTAYVDGTIQLMPELLLNLHMHTPRIMALNKPADGESFYGKLMAQAEADIKGPVNNMQITMGATALNGSDIYVPISNRKQVSENEYIVFRQPPSATTTRTPRRPRTTTHSSPFSLQATLSVTPGVTVHLPMDFDQLTANVTAVGRGDIQVAMRNGKEPDILGDYQFTSGNFSLSLLQLINKNFVIGEGSTLNFPGNINDARFNINAVYSQRVNLASLTGGNPSAPMTDTYVQVEDVITLSGTLQDPSIKFDILLPNAEQGVADQVFSYIDRNNERDILNQSISLLLLGQFSPAGTSESETNALTGGGGLGLLTSSASSIVSNLVKVVDVNFKYQAGSTSGKGQFDVGIRKQWNKFYFESTFGYGNNASGIESPTSNVLVGDVEAGYRFTPYFNLYGFHRSNTSYYTRTEMPYKQGVGVKLTKDFDHIYELLPWLRRKEKVSEE